MSRLSGRCNFRLVSWHGARQIAANGATPRAVSKYQVSAHLSDAGDVLIATGCWVALFPAGST